MVGQPTSVGSLHMTSKKHDYANYDQFAPNFVIAYKTIQRVLYEICSYLDKHNQSYWPKKMENFLLCYVGKWVDGHSFAYQHGCRNINV